MSLMGLLLDMAEDISTETSKIKKEKNENN
jgi:hypothetical protein